MCSLPICAMPVPAGCDVVVITAAFSHLQYWMSWTRLIFLPEMIGQAEATKLLKSLPALARHIVGDSPATGQYMYYVDLASETDVFKSDEIDRQTWLAEVFLVLHEYAHIIEGHTNARRGWPPENSLTPEQRLERRATQQQNEFEADRYAANALKQVVYQPPLESG